MAKVEEKSLALGRVYAAAMLDLAEQTRQGDDLLRELNDLASFLDKNPDFDSFLSSPTVEVDSRKKVFEKLFRGRYSDLLVDSLQVLNRKERLNILRAVAEMYHQLLEERRQRSEVVVRTVVPLTEEMRSRLREVAAQKTGRQVTLIEKLDPSLVGGLVVRIGDEKFDMSVSTRLDVMFDKLVDRASREMHGGRAFRDGAVAA